MLNINNISKDLLNVIICDKQNHLVHFVAKSVSKAWYNLVRKWYYKLSLETHTNVCLCPNIAFRFATTYGFVNLMRWLKDEKDIDDYLISEVILNKKFECLKCLNELGCKMSINSYCNAVVIGNLEIFTWLVINNPIKLPNLSILYWYALKYDRCEIITWISNNQMYFKI